jgi:hypothetical protein
MSYPIGTILVGDPEKTHQSLDVYEVTSEMECYHIAVLGYPNNLVIPDSVRERRLYDGNLITIPDVHQDNEIRIRVASEAEAFEIRLKLLIPTE